MTQPSNTAKKKGSGIVFALPASASPTVEGDTAGGAVEEVTGSGSATRPAPRTGVGLLATSVFESQRLENRIEELSAENEKLANERGGQWVDPKIIGPSRMANRHDDSFASPEFAEFKREIADSGGNVQPIKVRPLAGRHGDGIQYEIVFGHRRHRACLELGLRVLAVIEQLDDQSLFVQMERENRGRSNLSAWEQGRMYLRALEDGLFPSNRKLAEAVGRDLTDVGKAIRVAKLAPEITGAFPSPTSIQFGWVSKLEKALASHPDLVLGAARELTQRVPRSSAQEAFAALTRCLQLKEGGGVGSSYPQQRELTFGASRSGFVRLERDGRTTIELSSGTLDPARWDALEAALLKFLR